MAEEKQVYIVGGIAFHDMESAKMAQNELKRIELLDEKMDYGDVESVAAVYDKACKNNIFKTPIGISYMMRLQNCLLQNQYPGISEMPIPVQTEYGGSGAGRSAEGSREQNESIWKARLDRSREEVRRCRDKIRISVFVNILLLFLVIALFVISQTGKNPTILNYRSKVIDQYAQWQQELEERERVVEQKEAQLGIK